MQPLSDLLAFRPGGACWLMRHELRLFVAESAAAISRALHRAPNQRALPLPVLGWMVVIYLVLHAVAWSVLATLPYWRPVQTIEQLHLDGFAASVLFILMLSAALVRCVHVMYARNDLDLLLSSPVPGATILRARLGGVVVGILLLVLFLVSPIIHIGLLTGRPQLLALYPALIAMAAMAASFAMVIAVQLARLIGPRRAAIVAQAPGTVVVVGLYLMPRLLQAVPADVKVAFSNLLKEGALLGPASPLWLPVQALQGDPVALLLFCLAALGVAQLTVVFLKHRFLHALLLGRSQVRGVPRLSFGIRLHFGQGIRSLILYKEWLLILRQPMFLSQLSTKLAWLAVAFVAAGTSSLRPMVAAAVIVYATAALAGALTRLIDAGEQAQDLLASSPVAPAAVRAGKRWAALIPPVLLSMPVPLWLGIAEPKLGVLTAIALVGASDSAHRISRMLATSPNRQSHASASHMVSSLWEALSNGAWVLMLVISYAIF